MSLIRLPLIQNVLRIPDTNDYEVRLPGASVPLVQIVIDRKMTGAASLTRQFIVVSNHEAGVTLEWPRDAIWVGSGSPSADVIAVGTVFYEIVRSSQVLYILRLANADPDGVVDSHQHTLASILQSGATPTQVPTWNGTAWVPATPLSGGGGGSELTAMIAGQNMSSGRLVVASAGTVQYFDPTNMAHVGRGYGITKTSGLLGQQVTVQIFGVIQDAAFGFAADSIVFATTDGELTTTPPSSGHLQSAGVAIAANQLLINMPPTIVRI